MSILLIAEHDNSKLKVFKFELSCSAITKTDIKLLLPHF